jgi:type I restriction enzyme S subunit
MNGWSARKLSDLTTKIGSGATPRGGSSVYQSSGVALIRSQNVLDNAMKNQDIAFVTDEAARALQGVTVEERDVLINITGDSIARCSIVDPKVLPARVNQHVSIIRTTPDLDPRFLQRFLVNPSFKEQLLSMSSGGTRNALTKADLSNLVIHFPEIEEQRAIAEVLGTLDDKIAANTRLTQTLDNYFMARWSALSANDSLKQVKLTELVGDVIGGDWGNSESAAPSTEEVLCIRGADIADLQGSGLGSMPRRFIKPNSLRRRKLAHMDLVVEMSGGSPTQSTGRVVLITDAMLKRLPLPLSSSNFCRIVRLGNSQDAYFIYALLRESWIRGEFFQFENGSTGIKNLAFADFCSTKEVRMPGQWHLQDFNRLADGLFMQMQSLGEESARLKATRDALLPQLLSGKLRVRDADKVLENA